jgi:hypothetical protein
MGGFFFDIIVMCLIEERKRAKKEQKSPRIMKGGVRSSASRVGVLLGAREKS